jgi:hypothetical protein
MLFESKERDGHYMISHSKVKKARKLSFEGFRILAPRPGLEPGTCGLTEIQARQKPNKIKDL